MTKHTTCLTRPAIAGAATLGLTSLVLLAPTAHAAAPSADRPDAPTSAFSVSLTPVNTSDAAPAADRDAAQDALQDAAPDADGEALEEDRSGQATAEDGTAPDAAGDAASSASAVTAEAVEDTEAPEDTESTTAEDAAQEAATSPNDAPASDETTTESAAAENAATEQVGGDLMLWVDGENGVLCVETALTGVAPDAAAVHLHGAGGVQLDLPTSSGCLPADGSIIEADPAAYYVDVHTDRSSDAVARGELTRVPLGGVDAGQGAAGVPDWALPAAGAAVLAAAGAAVAMARRNRDTA